MISLKQKISAVFLILFLGFYFQSKHLQDFPQHVHAWAQSDRYAIALGFVNNNLNFFKPETFVYNHQFPDDFHSPSKYTITAVDFPIHDYCVAVLMKISGSTSPFIFRWYVLIFSFIGLYYLFKLTYLFSSSFYKSIFVLLFAGTSPIFVYYQSGFLPTIPSLACAIIGVYCYSKFRLGDRSSVKYLRLAFVFLTLAALSRLTFAIPLIAVSGIESLRFIRKRKVDSSIILTMFVSFVALGGYYLYNRYLTNTYGSLFLNSIRPPKGISEAFELLKSIKQNWFFDYFTKYHFLGFIIIGIVSLRTFLKNFKTKKNRSLLLLSITILLGALAFFVLMMKQFQNHDYYFLDTFFLPCILFLVLFVSNLSIEKSIVKIAAFGFTLVFLFFIQQKIIESQSKRYDVGSWNRVAQTVKNYEGAASFLADKKISKDAKLLVVGHFGPNIPFILMNRKGYLIKNASPYHFNRAKSWGIDYYIFQNEFFATEEFVANPSLINELEMKYTNGKIMLCTLRSVPKEQSLLSFMGFSKRKPLEIFTNNFERKNEKYWTVDSIISNKTVENNQMAVIDSSMQYGLSYKRMNLENLKTKARSVVISTDVSFDRLANAEIVVALLENGVVFSYQTRNLADIVKTANQWQTVDLLFNLPKVEGKNVEFSVFISNIGKAKLKVDDFEIKVF